MASVRRKNREMGRDKAESRKVRGQSEARQSEKTKGGQSETREGEAVEKAWESLGSQSTGRRTQQEIWRTLGSQSNVKEKTKNWVRAN